KSQHGVLKPLPASNRIEAMDAVINLRQMWAMLQDEREANSQKQHVKEFPIRYRNAADVETMLRELLGLKARDSGPEQPMTPQQMQMQMQMAQMRMQQAQQRG